MHSKECKGCAEILQEPTKKGKKRAVGKGKQPTTKRIQTQVRNQRVLRTRSQQVHYTFSDDEEGADDEIQGYLCVSADPRRSGPTEGGENFIITAEELRPLLQAQCKEKDQTVWMTTAQVGFPTTTTEGELDNDLDRQRGKPTVRCLHPVISAFILQRQQELVTPGQAPSMSESRTLESESEWDTQEEYMEVSDRSKDATEDTTWNLTLSSSSIVSQRKTVFKSCVPHQHSFPLEAEGKKAGAATAGRPCTLSICHSRLRAKRRCLVGEKTLASSRLS
jgi:hypothetical protein